MATIAVGTGVQQGWKHLVLNGSGLGVAAVGANSTNDGAHDVALYDVSDTLVVDDLVATFMTPGRARAVALHNGLAYVADGFAGMQVINYLGADIGDSPPTVSFSTSQGGTTLEEGSRVNIRVRASDDVQVRNVALLLDGTVVQRDGQFPFQFFITAPLLTQQDSVSVQVRQRHHDGSQHVHDHR